MERVFSGVFHRHQSGNNLQSVPSRMDMQQRRDFSKTHKPEWPLQRVVKSTNNPAKEAFVGFYKAFAIAFGGKAAMGIVLGLIGRKSSLLNVLKEACGLDTLRFASFFGLYCGTLRGVANQVCQMRNGTNDRLNAIIGGLVASLTLLVDDAERRRTIAIFVFVRAMSVLVKELSRENILPYHPQAESILFGIVNMPIMYGFLLEPDILDKGYYKFILGMGNVTDKGLDITLRERFREYCETGAYQRPLCSCQPHYHTGSCVGYCTYDWFLGLARAGKIYAPVHILPLLLFRYKKLMEKPQQQITETAMALAYSCMFLTTYQFTVKFSQCMLRNFRQEDAPWHTVLAGLLTGFACLFERPSRVSELMLYCVPKSLEAMWNYGVKHFGFKSVPYFELGLFMIGNSIIVASLKEDLKSTYFNAVEFLVTGEFRKKDNQKKLKKDAKPVATDEVAAVEEKEEAKQD